MSFVELHSVLGKRDALPGTDLLINAAFESVRGTYPSKAKRTREYPSLLFLRS